MRDYQAFNILVRNHTIAKRIAALDLDLTATEVERVDPLV
jgi:hypothetical protein